MAFGWSADCAGRAHRDQSVEGNDCVDADAEPAATARSEPWRQAIELSYHQGVEAPIVGTPSFDVTLGFWALTSGCLPQCTTTTQELL
jgi:hypothetical protein